MSPTRIKAGNQKQTYSKNYKSKMIILVLVQCSVGNLLTVKPDT